MAGLRAGIDVPPDLTRIEQELSYLNEEMISNLFELPRDIYPVETEINQLNNQVLVRYYDEEWRGKD